MRMAPIQTRSQATESTTHIRAGGIPEIRGERRLCFYAAVFGVTTTIYEGGSSWREIVLPGAFDESLRSAGEVYGRVEHDPARIFARRSVGELMLAADPRGLFASCYLPDSPLGNEILRDVSAGRLRGCSFAFRTVREIRHEPDASGMALVELLALELLDVALTGNPAYPGTVVSVRSNRERERDRDRARRVRLLKLRAV